MALVTALVCELATVAVRAFQRRDDPLPKLAALAGLLLFGSLVAGTLTLLLTPMVWRLRRVPPPVGITVFAVIVAVTPLVALLALAASR